MQDAAKVAGKICDIENNSGKSLLRWSLMELKEKIAHHTCPVGYSHRVINYIEGKANVAPL